jgi:hypothetical protein
MKKTTILGTRKSSDSGSANKELSDSAQATYSGALKAAGTKRQTMDEFVREDTARKEQVAASRAKSAQAMRGR